MVHEDTWSLPENTLHAAVGSTYKMDTGVGMAHRSQSALTWRHNFRCGWYGQRGVRPADSQDVHQAVSPLSPPFTNESVISIWQLSYCSHSTAERRLRTLEIASSILFTIA